jgi:uncharacterized protein
MAQTPDQEGRRPNHLIDEKSPYLFQHAHNPVDWYPWGKEAFAKAKRQDKPVFLSIGYATCHWCHVMEHESFEDAEVAALMNETFVSIKVDREERPDIDQVYMTVCQMLTGSGGWPLTVLMTADKQPFFAGTYFPKHGRFGRPGMMDLVPRVGQLWKTNRAELLQSAGEIVRHLERASSPAGSGNVTADLLDEAGRQLAARFDPEHGGFCTAPKFPTPHNLTFLLRHWRRTGDARALDMVEKTLTEMRRGGVYDQVGFGFHRYSTDQRWHVPHFEKMLYDQALLTIAYLDANQAAGKEEYAATAREILTYVERDMTSTEGAFFSAEDADSEGEEGKFYVWTEDEMRELLLPDEAEAAIAAWNVTADGNYADEATGRPTGANILHLDGALRKVAGRLGIEEGVLAETLAAARTKLLAARSGRIRPLCDDKVLADWNGLMIAAFARAARILGEPRFAGTAGRAAHFILSQMREGNGRLLHRYRGGESAGPAFLDDHAFLVRGLIELYESTFEPGWLEHALAITDATLDRFPAPDGGFYLTSDDADALLVRPRDIYDGAAPSGASVLLEDLLMLSRLTSREGYEARAHALAKSAAGDLARGPSAHTAMLGALSTLHAPSFEIVIVGDPASDDTRALLGVVNSRFLPGSVVLLVSSGPETQVIHRLAPYTTSLTPIDGKATAYVCRDFACDLPTTDVAQLQNMLEVRR